MTNPSRLLALTGVLLVLLFTASARADYADPPERVARLSNSEGDVSFSPSGENDWVSVVRNRPLYRGDRLWTDRDARAEFQVGSAAIRLGSDTSFEILELNDRMAQFQITQGTLNLSVRRLYDGQTFEVDTPTLAFTLSREGRYRVEVDPVNNVTIIQIRDGAGVAYGTNSNFPMIAGDNVRFYDTDLRDYELYSLPREDDFDRYCLERDQRLTRSVSLRYVDDDVVGYSDLDEYGSWRPVNNYGTVWFPSRVEADWAPYQDGHWVWQEPWGWTWVDNAPWGFAPSHYGRWVYVSNNWGWIPGPRHVRPVYAPALVAFIGGSNWSVSMSLGSPIGWFPLGPREVYVPSYQASRDYFTRVNVNNTVINNTTINNVYNNYSTGTINVNQVNYVNRTVAGAVTAVPSNVFVNAQTVKKARISIDRNAATSGEVMRIATVAPNQRSVIGAGNNAKSRPAREVFDRKVFVRNAPPPGMNAFAAREQQLKKNPGRALDPGATRQQGAGTAEKLRVISKQSGAVDARAAGSRRSGDRPSSAPGQPRAQDRPVEPGSRSGSVSGDQTRNRTIIDQSKMNQQEQRQRQIDAQQQEQQQQSRAESDRRNAAQQQQTERQRQTETQQQEQRQRKADSALQAEEQQRAERQRVNEVQRQEQRQRKADNAQPSSRQQQVERQRQAAPLQQEPAVPPDQVQATPPATPTTKQVQAAKTKAQQLAECERQAILRNQDPKQCRKPQQQDRTDNPRTDNRNRR